MKRAWIISVLVLLTALAALVADRLRERPLPLEQCGAEYAHFSNDPGFRLAHIDDFPINDSLRVPVTILTATDSISWLRLKEFFRIPEPTALGKELMDEGVDDIWQRIHAENPDGSIINLVFSHLNHTVSIFYLRNQDEYMAVFLYSVELGITNSYTNQDEKNN